MVYAALLAGGIGTRTGSKFPKQFLKLNNRPMITYCIDNFIMLDEFKEIIVSSPPKFLQNTRKIMDDYFPTEDRIVVIEGGETRQDTILNSINYIESIASNDDPIIVTHDAARIFVSPELIKTSICNAKKYGAASPVIPAIDVMVESKENGIIESMPIRENIFHVQTPQAFKAFKFKKIYENMSSEEKDIVKEATKLFFMKGEEVFLFEGEDTNFKITTSSDLKMAEVLLKNNL